METIQDLFKTSKQEWLEKARETARQIGENKRLFTIEDVLLVCPLPTYLHRNTIGSVFHHEDFKPVGYSSSRRQISHGRTIRTWTLTSQPALLPRIWRYGRRSEAMVE